MARPRVTDDKRIRIRNACGFCKMRKQKCDGKSPCGYCVRKKNVEHCSYSEPTPRKPSEPKVTPSLPKATSSSPGRASSPRPQKRQRSDAHQLPVCLPSPPDSESCGSDSSGSDSSNGDPSRGSCIGAGTEVTRPVNVHPYVSQPRSNAAKALPNPTHAHANIDDPPSCVAATWNAPTLIPHLDFAPAPLTTPVAVYTSDSSSFRIRVARSYVNVTGDKADPNMGPEGLGTRQRSLKKEHTSKEEFITGQEHTTKKESIAKREPSPRVIERKTNNKIPSAGGHTAGPDQGLGLHDVRIPDWAYSSQRKLARSDGRGVILSLNGRSSHLSHLDVLRNMFEVRSLHDPFRRRLDRRYHLLECKRHDVEPQSLGLLDPEEAVKIVKSFLVNTHGLIQVFHEKETLEESARKIVGEGIEPPEPHPDNQEKERPEHQALLYLALAIGLVMTVPESASDQDSTLPAAEAHFEPQAEAYFQTAMALSQYQHGARTLDQLCVMILMVVYLFAVVRREEAFECIGHAWNLAQQIALQEEQLQMRFGESTKNTRPWSFDPEITPLRRNVWCSLVLLDRLCAAQLGREPSIPQHTAFPPPSERIYPDSSSLVPAHRTTEILGMILHEVYTKLELASVGLSPVAAADIARLAEGWPYKRRANAWGASRPLGVDESGREMPRDPDLDLDSEWQHSRIGKLHSRLLELHNVVLLGRPFVLHDGQVRFTKEGFFPAKTGSFRGLQDIKQTFAKDSIEAGSRSITLIREALRHGYLSRRNPFILYFLFSAALVVLTQDFATQELTASLELPAGGLRSSIEDTIQIMNFLAPRDHNAAHLLEILTYLLTKSNLKELAGPTRPTHQTCPPNCTPSVQERAFLDLSGPFEDAIVPPSNTRFEPPPRYPASAAAAAGASMTVQGDAGGGAGGGGDGADEPPPRVYSARNLPRWPNEIVADGEGGQGRGDDGADAGEGSCWLPAPAVPVPVPVPADPMPEQVLVPAAAADSLGGPGAILHGQQHHGHQHQHQHHQWECYDPMDLDLPYALADDRALIAP